MPNTTLYQLAPDCMEAICSYLGRDVLRLFSCGSISLNQLLFRTRIERMDLTCIEGVQVEQRFLRYLQNIHTLSIPCVELYSSSLCLLDSIATLAHPYLKSLILEGRMSDRESSWSLRSFFPSLEELFVTCDLQGLVADYVVLDPPPTLTTFKAHDIPRQNPITMRLPPTLRHLELRGIRVADQSPELDLGAVIAYFSMNQCPKLVSLSLGILVEPTKEKPSKVEISSKSLVDLSLSFQLEDYYYLDLSDEYEDYEDYPDELDFDYELGIDENRHAVQPRVPAFQMDFARVDRLLQAENSTITLFLKMADGAALQNVQIDVGSFTLSGEMPHTLHSLSVCGTYRPVSVLSASFVPPKSLSRLILSPALTTTKLSASSALLPPDLDYLECSILCVDFSSLPQNLQTLNMPARWPLDGPISVQLSPLPSSLTVLYAPNLALQTSQIHCLPCSLQTLTYEAGECDAEAVRALLPHTRITELLSEPPF